LHGTLDIFRNIFIRYKNLFKKFIVDLDIRYLKKTNLKAKKKI
jgi:hypothetical protein